jgi:hypothetical protein
VQPVLVTAAQHVGEAVQRRESILLCACAVRKLTATTTGQHAAQLLTVRNDVSECVILQLHRVAQVSLVSQPIRSVRSDSDLHSIPCVQM